MVSQLRCCTLNQVANEDIPHKTFPWPGELNHALRVTVLEILSSLFHRFSHESSAIGAYLAYEAVLLVLAYLRRGFASDFAPRMFWSAVHAAVVRNVVGNENVAKKFKVLDVPLSTGLRTLV